MKLKLRKYLHDEKGAVMVFVAISIVALMSIAAFVIDVGYLNWDRKQMVSAADAAALAGAQELIFNEDTGEDRINAAKDIAEEYAKHNGAIDDLINIEVVSDYLLNGELFEAVIATVGVERGFSFARVLGFDTTNVMARAVAIHGFPNPQGVFPILYHQENFDQGPPDNLPKGNVVLIDKFIDDAPGNWSYINIEDPGKNIIKKAISGEEEYMITLALGNEIETETGGVSFHTQVRDRMIRAINNYDSLQDRVNYMTVLVPVTRAVPEQGKTTIVVEGFAYFQIKDVIFENNPVKSPINNKWYAVGVGISDLNNNASQNTGGARYYYYDAENEELNTFRTIQNDILNTDLSPLESDSPGVEAANSGAAKQAIGEYLEQGRIIGQFVEFEGKKLVDPSSVGSVTQNPMFDFGIYVVRLVE